MPNILGLQIGRTSPHTASKPGHLHVTDVAADDARKAQRAQAWGKATGRPIPPQLRARQPLRRPTRRSSDWRLQRYLGCTCQVPPTGIENAMVMDVNCPMHRPGARATLTPAQFRRLTRKAGMSPAQRAALRAGE